MPKYCVVYNPSAGSISKRRLLEDLFETKKLQAVFIKCDQRLGANLAKAIDNGSKVLVAAGGDGTVNTVAAFALKLKLPLGIVPIGSYNHFAKDLKLPMKTAEAVAVIAVGKTTAVDVGTLNSRLFLNLASLGIYPHLVHIRHKASRVLGKHLGNALGVASAGIWPLQYDLDFTIDGKRLSRRASLVVVANNSYQTGRTGFTNRTELNRGWLSLYIIKAGHPWQVVRLTIKSYLGKTDADPDFEEYTAKRISITPKRIRGRIPIALDGELAHLTSPLIYSMKPKSLKVIVDSRF